jgi:undecaprenyl-diphosphatase
MIPAGILGIAFGDAIEGVFSNPRLVGLFLMVTGLLLAGLKCAPKGRKPIDAKTAGLMGVFQAIALLPGISRSGSTICAGLWCRADRALVGRFAFLMAIPPIAGAAILQGRKGLSTTIATTDLLLGMGIAFFSGTVALTLLMKFVRGGQLHWFAPYCLVLGLIAILSS